MDLETLRHSCSHIMASAVKKVYPQAKLAIGPSIDTGFYYDFDIPQGIKEEDFARIEQLMREEINKKLLFVKEEWSSEQAIAYFTQQDQPYKVELITDLKQPTISIYKHGDFVDLCRGPHVNATNEVKYFKLLSTSGAYWRGDEKNAQLVRIYGTAFSTKEELETHLKNLEEAKKRDHRVLGRELELFDIYHQDAGAGLVFYLPKGAVLRKLIEDWEIDQHQKRGYQRVITPHIMDKNLWQRSGHLDFYAENMYPIQKDNQEFILKPMNCPGHILIYKSKTRSWRDLPLRMFELGTVYRFEKAGAMHGLLRVRGFTQDDAHIFCRKQDLSSEIEGVLDFIKQTMDKFGFQNYTAELSTRPAQFIGHSQDWDLAEGILEDVLKNKGIAYTINKGDGAFYGPKIDIKLKDALNRQWQCATVQLDYNIPERFDLTYRDLTGKDERVVMLHRVILGSIERFIATLVEHYAGRFPFWLAPVQASVLSITDETKDYAQSIVSQLEQAGLRVELDAANETLQKKIRRQELMRVPYMIIVGKKEKESETVSLRARGMKDLGIVSLKELIDKLNQAENI